MIALKPKLSESVQGLGHPNLSLGVDLVFIPEFRKALEEPGTAFFDKTFTRWELAKASAKSLSERAVFFSGRYSAKEAFVKALDGPRIHLPPAFRFLYSEIEIRNDEFGRPYCRFYGNLSDYMKKTGSSVISLSITHVEEYAFSEILLSL
ncbi:holo-ACP synthase [Leptospira fletcheri]|uniref:Holo-[acyl-carrier-protein] synthase n=1 Tax=Leptospira fletcheri TaxID=2484981 RepID=A0A4R9GHW7_9LEPT|nr:holo-ACP synthase [Leptospira fletcheri]TGK11971.1 holo-ACP synthase [Leptospira fletcheri]